MSVPVGNEDPPDEPSGLDLTFVEDKEKVVENAAPLPKKIRAKLLEMLSQIVDFDPAILHNWSDEELRKLMQKIKTQSLLNILKKCIFYAYELKEELDAKQIRARRNRCWRKRSTPTDKRNANSEASGGSEQVSNGAVADTQKSESSILDHDFNFFKHTRVTSQGFEVSHYQPLLIEGGVMRSYQLKGLHWMINHFINGVNSILADEMGLGKTLQVIGLICDLIEKGMIGPFLIIAPLSTLGNWVSEFKKFAPLVPTVLLHGSKKYRKNVIRTISESTVIMNRPAMKVVITSFETAKLEKRALSKTEWLHITVDEGHRIKNPNADLTRALRHFSALGKLLLTGTPLQNDLCELWGLLNFIIPEVFNDLGAFSAWFDINEFENNGLGYIDSTYSADIISTLQKILMPFLLRREKKDVKIELPPKKEILVYCPMTAIQKQLYTSTVDRSIEYLLNPKRKEPENLFEPLPKRACVLNKNINYNEDYVRYSDEIEDGKQSNTVNEKKDKEYEINVQLRNPQMQLRKIVNHPYLIQFPLIPGTNELRIDEDLIKSSGKLMVVDGMLKKLKAEGHKVVIFSSFKPMLDILEDLSDLRNYKYCRMDGSSRQKDRQKYITEFNENPEVFLFLVSIRSGGLGINLTGADTIIIYDSDWNPQMNLQSEDRCHRLGQKKPVVIYKLCVRGTIDQRIIETGNKKRMLEKMIIQKGTFSSGLLDSDNNSKLMDLKQLKELLLATDYDAAIHSNGVDGTLEGLTDRSGMFNTEDSVDNCGQPTEPQVLKD